MKEAYLNCLRKLREFRKKLSSKEDIKRGKMYFSWLETKTKKVEHEKDDNYIYEQIIKYTLPNYKIDKYSYERLDKELKGIIANNYILNNDNQYIFNNSGIAFSDVKLITNKIILKRSNVVWIDFGFNIGNEFGGMHPAIILKGFEKELLVLPVSSKKPKEYKKIEQEYKENKITKEELINREKEVTTIVQLDKIYRFKKMIRWTDITRVRKVSILRVNFSGTVGKVEGRYMNEISTKISKEF